MRLHNLKLFEIHKMSKYALRWSFRKIKKSAKIEECFEIFVNTNYEQISTVLNLIECTQRFPKNVVLWSTESGSISTGQCKKQVLRAYRNVRYIPLQKFVF